jgi:hypothetical protein
MNDPLSNILLGIIVVSVILGTVLTFLMMRNNNRSGN